MDTLQAEASTPHNTAPGSPGALYGPYGSKSEALKAEYALKHSKRGIKRAQWTPKDSSWCKGLGAQDPWVLEADRDAILSKAAPSEKPTRPRRRRRRRR